MRNQQLQLIKSKLLQRLRASSPGRVAPAILLWILGVPGGIVLLLWFFLWRGK
jgi:hypothetical protein